MKEYYQLLEDIARQSATVRMLQKALARTQANGQSSRTLASTCKSEEHKLDLLLARRAEAQATEEALTRKNLYKQRELEHVIHENADSEMP